MYVPQLNINADINKSMKVTGWIPVIKFLSLCFFICGTHFVVLAQSTLPVNQDSLSSGSSLHPSPRAEKTSSNADTNAESFADQHVWPTLRRSVDERSLQIISLGVATVLIAREQDDRVREQWVDHQKMSQSDADIGNFLGTGIPGLTIAFSQLYFDRLQGQAHLRALVYTELMTTTMKSGFGRNRPGSSNNHRSFPSGHTSTTFASATALTYAYGWKAAAVAYPLALFTGASRLADDAHWFSDVVAGAFVGLWWGRASANVANPNMQFNTSQSSTQSSDPSSSQASGQISTQGRWSWWPLLSSQEAGVLASYEF